MPETALPQLNGFTGAPHLVIYLRIFMPLLWSSNSNRKRSTTTMSALWLFQDRIKSNYSLTIGYFVQSAPRFFQRPNRAVMSALENQDCFVNRLIINLAGVARLFDEFYSVFTGLRTEVHFSAGKYFAIYRFQFKAKLIVG